MALSTRVYTMPANDAFRGERRPADGGDVGGIAGYLPITPLAGGLREPRS